HWRSTPLNYLEKIFQIPFTLRPMPKVGFEGLIDHLAAAPVGSTPADSTNAEPDGTEVVSVEASISTPQTRDGFEREVLPKVGVAQSEPSVKSKGAVVTPPKIASEHLRIEEWEREVMKRLFGLIPSPRAAKRFVNIYRLLRASVPDEQREAFIGDEEHGTHREVLLLLAILVGFPSEATDIMRALLEREPTESWWDFIEGFRAKSNGTGPGANSKQAAELDRRQELLKKLDQVRDLIPETERCDHFIQWAWEVARFSFQSGRIVRGQEQGDSPLRNGF
ncbi:MAG TPA: hypothetical protein VJ302_19230, partial [Blastocatellia bacterium]|nr:hypothetical protein [Blastocatellia bacterium]